LIPSIAAALDKTPGTGAPIELPVAQSKRIANANDVFTILTFLYFLQVDKTTTGNK
jgi:hypothetical protein